jgi:AcrR family transcriptional regulator
MATTTTIRRSGAARREEIAKTVLQIIGHRGLGALSTTTLAAEIGVTSGALFRHFASRDEMLEAAVHYALQRIDATFPAASLSPLERVMGLARNRVHLLGSEPGIAWLLRSEQAYLSLPPDAVSRLREAGARSRRFLVDALADGARTGSIRNDAEPEVLVVPVMGTIHALAGMTGVHGGLSAGRRRTNVDDVLSALEHMLMPAPKPKLAARNPRVRTLPGRKPRR